MGYLMKAMFVGAFGALAVSIPAAAPAQTEEQTKGGMVDAVPVCMIRPLGDVPQVPTARRGRPFRIITLERAAPGLEAKGFTRVDCTTADLVQVDKRRGWRNEICEIAAVGNEAVQNQFERAYGERPAVLCAAAQLVVGPWDRKRARRK